MEMYMPVQVQTPRFEDVKPGDLIRGRDGIFDCVVIGSPTPKWASGGHTDLNTAIVEEGILCYRRFKRTVNGGLFPLNSHQWKRGAAQDYHSKDADPELSQRLLKEAIQDIDRQRMSLMGTLKVDLPTVRAEAEKLLTSLHS